VLPSAHTPAGSLRGLGRRVPKAVPRRLDLRVCRAVAAGPHLGGGDRILRYVIANDRAGYPVQNARLTSCKCTWRQRQDDCQSTNPPRQHETPPNLEKFSPTRDDQTRLAEANQSELGMAFITEYQHLTGAQPTQVSLLERGDRTLRIGARARIVRLRCLATSARHGKVQLRNGLEIDPSAGGRTEKLGDLPCALCALEDRRFRPTGRRVLFHEPQLITPDNKRAPVVLAVPVWKCRAVDLKR
jgi:hypothetical protein